MKMLKVLYIWLAVLALLDLYGRLFPAGTAPEAVKAGESLPRGNGAAGPARVSRGP